MRELRANAGASGLRRSAAIALMSSRRGGEGSFRFSPRVPGDARPFSSRQRRCLASCPRPCLPSLPAALGVTLSLLPSQEAQVLRVPRGGWSRGRCWLRGSHPSRDRQPRTPSPFPTSLGTR